MANQRLEVGLLDQTEDITMVVAGTLTAGKIIRAEISPDYDINDLLIALEKLKHKVMQEFGSGGL